MTNEQIVSEIKKGNDTKKNLEYLYKSNIPILRMLVKPYSNENTFDDMMQLAFLGILAAIPGYDESRGSFIQYAKFFIKSEIKDFRRVNDLPFVVSSNVYGNCGKIKKALSYLTQEYHRKPTEKELCDYTGLSLKQVRECETVLSPIMSIDSPCGEDDFGVVSDVISDGRDLEGEIIDSLNNENQSLSLWEIIEETLSNRQFEILRLHYIEGKSLPEIADKYGITRQRVHQIEQKAFSRLMQNHVSARFLAAEIEAIGYEGYKGVGVRAFHQRWASSVENVALRREYKKERFSRMIRESEKSFESRYLNL